MQAHFLCCEACGSPKASSALLKNKSNPRVEAAGQDQSSAGTDGDGGADPEQLDEWRKGKRCKVSFEVSSLSFPLKFSREKRKTKKMHTHR